MSLSDFFKDKNGKVVIIQPPNVLILSWIVLQLLDLFIARGKVAGLSVLTTAVLFTWAYLELTHGVSPFRKALGGVVLLGILVMLFIRSWSE